MRLGVNERAAPPQFTTNQVYLHIYGGSDRRTFYSEFFHYIKNWGVGHSGIPSVPKRLRHGRDISSGMGYVSDYWIIKDNPNQLVLGVQYYYSGGYDRGRARRAILGAEPTGPGARGSGIGFKPVVLRSGDNTATIYMTKVTPGGASSDGLRLYMYTCEGEHSCKNSRTFFSRNYSYRKEWYAR